MLLVLFRIHSKKKRRIKEVTDCNCIGGDAATVVVGI